MPIAFNPLLPGPETRAPSVRVRGRTPPDVLVTPVSVDRAHNHTGLELVVGDPGTLTSSDFDGSKPTKILIHGWLGDAVDYESVCMMLKAEYLESGNYNVVCVDWAVLAIDLPYITARLRCRIIGNCVADLVSMLVDNSAQTVDDIHIIGFSMGAHIAGYVGKRFDGRLQRITGLDPARPLFFSRMPSERLNENDATFVDVVHTTSFLLGEHKPIGKIDFYPNGGYTRQPGCRGIYFFGEVCSHYKSYEYYARSIQSEGDESFKAVRCEQWEDYKKSTCKDYDDFTYMGEYASSNFSGNYYLAIK
uniref:Lipase member H-B n=1 Tax=Sipha flava TaxID=143950 RepID=A0A2S2R8G8_9HEMI